MTQRTKLELEINKPTELELLYDEPVTGKSQYGDYFLYAVKVNGSEYSYFPNEEIHEKLKTLRRGDKAVVTKLASQRGNKLVTVYNVDVGESSASDSLPQQTKDSDDRYYSIMLQSYRDALKINNELNGMVDPSKIAVTLFIARTRE
jgi:hypothetical protein